MKRSIDKHIEEAKRFMGSHRGDISMDIDELQRFKDQSDNEKPIDAICDSFFFGFAVGVRAAKRDAKRAKA